MKQLDRISRARAQLVTSAPFFGVLALSLELVEDSSIETMATDGKSLFVAPEFAAGLSDAELRGVLAHETLHCAYRHMTRRGARDHALFNEACDYAINLDCLDAGFTLPAGGLIDRQYAGMTAEAIYAKLAKERQEQKQQSGASGAGVGKPQSGQGTAQGASGAPGQGQGQANGQGQGNGAPQGQTGAGADPGRCGAVLDAPQGEAAELDQEWQGKALMAAAIAAKQAGAMPAGLARLINELRAPRVSWREALRRFVTDSTTRDYSWSRPNRRHIAGGLYLPSLVSDGRGHVAIALDTSGSIDAAALAAFTAELQAMLDESAADRVTIVHCDAKVRHVETFESGDRLEIKPHGGGGTRFSPALDYIAEHCADAACAVYFTDLESSDFGNEPATPVLWAVWGENRAAPFGEVVAIDGHDA